MAQYKKDLPCIEPDCHRLVGDKGGRGRCAPCNQALRRAESRANPRPCSVPGCKGTVTNAGTTLCDMHRNRLRRHGDVGKPQPLIGPRGFGTTQKDGYRLVAKRFEHRSAMEELLGRALVSGETVHHVNGQRGDNRTNGPLVNFRSGNLELWSSKQPFGQRVVDKVEFAVELLRLYAPHLLVDGVPMPMTNASFHGRSAAKSDDPNDLDKPGSKPDAEDKAEAKDPTGYEDHEKAVAAAHAHHAKEARKVGMH